nr:MAG TPA: hypothetical protein [Caudoviricetes sp.]
MSIFLDFYSVSIHNLNKFISLIFCLSSCNSKILIKGSIYKFCCFFNCRIRASLFASCKKSFYELSIFLFII